MWLIDANVILRYLLGDNEEMQSEAEKVIDEGAFTLPEVLAEVVYVLTKVYGSHATGTDLLARQMWRKKV